MKKFRTIYVCDKCGFEHEDTNYFREIIGNIKTPESKSTFSNNIWNTKEVPQNIKSAMSNKTLPVVYGDANIIITSSTLCLKCFIKELLSITPSIAQNDLPINDVESYEKSILMQALGLEPDVDSVKQSVHTPIRPKPVKSNGIEEMDGLPFINASEILKEVQAGIPPMDDDEIEDYENTDLPEFVPPTPVKK